MFMEMACQHGQSDILSQLLGWRPDVPLKFLQSALLVAVTCQQESCIRVLHKFHSYAFTSDLFYLCAPKGIVVTYSPKNANSTGVVQIGTCQQFVKNYEIVDMLIQTMSSVLPAVTCSSVFPTVNYPPVLPSFSSLSPPVSTNFYLASVECNTALLLSKLAPNAFHLQKYIICAMPQLRGSEILKSLLVNMVQCYEIVNVIAAAYSHKRYDVIALIKSLNPSLAAICMGMKPSEQVPMNHELDNDWGDQPWYDDSDPLQKSDIEPYCLTKIDSYLTQCANIAISMQPFDQNQYIKEIEAIKLNLIKFIESNIGRKQFGLHDC